MILNKNLNTERSIFIKNYLIENYPSKPKKDMMDELNLSYNYISKMACLFGLKRDFNDSKTNKTLIKLLDLNDNITCYWIGFLLADGHISEIKNIQVNINIKDRYFFENIQNHINIKLRPFYNDNPNVIRYTISDKETITKLSLLFDWKTNKTKNPPTIPKLSHDQLFSLIIGFIDGDGSISKNGKLMTVKCDLSWKEILEYFSYILTNNIKIFNKTSDNCSMFFITSPKMIKSIKNKCLLLNLPIMKRKWDRVNINTLYKEDRYLIIENLLNNNESVKDIIKKTNFSHGLVYRVINYIRERDTKREMKDITG